MNIILDDRKSHWKFAPISLMRPVGDIRMGIFTNTERWKFFLPNAHVSHKTVDYLSDLFPSNLGEDTYWLNACVIPNEALIEALLKLKFGEELWANDTFVAYKGEELEQGIAVKISMQNLVILEERWDVYQQNNTVLKQDFQLLTKINTSAKLSGTNLLIGEESQLFISPTARVEGAILNVQSGPIYIGDYAEIMEGSVVRGGLALCQHAALKLSTKVYGATTIGPHCKVGGEVNNVVFQAYSNKGHDGFLGNSVIGEWCNLGADTNTSNLKNNYGNVRAYDYESKAIKETGQQFMGLMMGDHSKSGINTMFNTATVVGVSATVFGGGFPPKFIPSFAWGGMNDKDRFIFNKAIEAANNMMVRRNKQLSEKEIQVLHYLFHHNV